MSRGWVFKRDLVTRFGFIFDELRFWRIVGVRQFIGLHGCPEFLGLIPGAERTVEVEHSEGVGLDDFSIEVLGVILSRPNQQQFSRLAIDLVDGLHPRVIDHAVDRPGRQVDDHRPGLRQVRHRDRVRSGHVGGHVRIDAVVTVIEAKEDVGVRQIQPVGGLKIAEQGRIQRFEIHHRHRPRHQLSGPLLQNPAMQKLRRLFGNGLALKFKFAQIGFLNGLSRSTRQHGAGNNCNKSYDESCWFFHGSIS